MQPPQTLVPFALFSLIQAFHPLLYTDKLSIPQPDHLNLLHQKSSIEGPIEA